MPQSRNSNERVTPDPLQKCLVNVVEDSQWCMVFQSPHSPKYCDIVMSLATSQGESQEQSDLEDHTDSGYNVLESHYDDNSYNSLSSNNDVTFRRPTKEEIDAITFHMVS